MVGEDVPERVTLAQNAGEVDAWLQEHVIGPACTLVALDCEWEPRSHVTSGVHLIQLAVPAQSDDGGPFILLVQVRSGAGGRGRGEAVSATLRGVLESKATKLLVADARQDRIRLGHMGVRLNGITELEDMCRRTPVMKKRLYNAMQAKAQSTGTRSRPLKLSLMELYSMILGGGYVPKDQALQRGHWSVGLTADMIRYAADDVSMVLTCGLQLFQLFHKFIRKKIKDAEEAQRTGTGAADGQGSVFVQVTPQVPTCDINHSATAVLNISNRGKKARPVIGITLLQRAASVAIEIPPEAVQSKSKHRKTWTSVSGAIEDRATGGQEYYHINHRIPVNDTMGIKMSVTPTVYGHCTCIIIVDFNGFSTARFIEFSCEDAATIELIAPSAPFKRKAKARRVIAPPHGRHGVDQGRFPERFRESPTTTTLAQFNPDKAECTKITEQGSKGLQLALGATTAECYAKQLSLMQQIEELRMRADLLQFDRKGVAMDQARDYLVLRVPGLAEGRPSVLVGDAIHVARPGATLVYEGFVHQVEQEELWLKFSQRFHGEFVRGQLYDVSFTLSRLCLRRMYNAIDQAKKNSALCERLVPIPWLLRNYSDMAPPPEDHYQHLFTERILTNTPQATAISKMLAGRYSPYPFVLFGPPGTGKTTVVVEFLRVTKQVVMRSGAHMFVLLCAPSNAACDVLTARLGELNFDRTELIRVCAVRRAKASVPEEVLKYTKYDRNEDCFQYPTAAEMQTKKIIVATLSTASMVCAILHESATARAFSHVLVDEAGQATEPEILCALTSVRPETRVILAGDPLQLGPIIHSGKVQNWGSPSKAVTELRPCGLDVSMLERLCSMPAYSVSDGLYVVKLIKNFRSHKSIIEVPNNLFYSGELEPVQSHHRERMCHWEGLPQMGFPVMFHGINGKDEREANSPSWFNTHEVQTVIRLIEQLRESKNPRVTMATIGIITPYRKQVQKFRRVLQAKNMGAVEVDTVEAYQGREKSIIIISTVRSNADFLEFDAQHKLGFLRNPKRFNVAVTRAKELLIVVGNPSILSRDKHWKALFDYCVRNGSYTGVAVTPNLMMTDETMNNLSKSLGAVKLEDGGDEDASHETAFRGQDQV